MTSQKNGSCKQLKKNRCSATYLFTDFEALNFQPNGQSESLYCQHQTAQILKGSEQVNIVRKWQTYTLGIQIRNSKIGM